MLNNSSSKKKLKKNRSFILDYCSVRASQLAVLTSLCCRDAECYRIQSKALRIKGRKHRIQIAQGVPSRFPLPKELYTSDRVSAVVYHTDICTKENLFSQLAWPAYIQQLFKRKLHKSRGCNEHLKTLHLIQWFDDNDHLSAGKCQAEKAKALVCDLAPYRPNDGTISAIYKAKLTLNSTDKITNQVPQQVNRFGVY